MAAQKTLSHLNVVNIEGNTVNLACLIQGKRAVLVVNIATQAGNSEVQFDKLRALSSQNGL